MDVGALATEVEAELRVRGGLDRAVREAIKPLTAAQARAIQAARRTGRDR